jgi:sugar/nucleoside kinase (ribokinase family)
MGSKRIICLGEALVDFVCERPVSSLGEADFFVPRLGGSLANIAVAAARFGGQVEMLGGAGDDEWGRWLRRRVAAEGVGTNDFVLVEDMATSHAFVSVSEDGEPSFAFYGDVERAAEQVSDRVDDVLSGDPGVLVVGSDTLLGEGEREVTMQASQLARGRGWEVLCDPNLRPNRWDTPEEMVDTITSLVKNASVVKLNEGEALTLTRRNEVTEAGRALLRIGPSRVVVTRSAQGALMLAEDAVESVGAAEAEVVDATGAGDCVAGVIAAGIARDLPLTSTVGAAMEAAARVVAVWGATAGLPDEASARALLDANG